jgi:hypothetical protein
MDPQILMQINEIYRNEVYSEPESADINHWVSQLISEGYDLDNYSDEELYEAYLEDLDEGWRPANTGKISAQAFKLEKQKDPNFKVLDTAVNNLLSKSTRTPTSKNIVNRNLQLARLQRNKDRAYGEVRRHGATSDMSAPEVQKKVTDLGKTISDNDIKQRAINTIANMQTRRTPEEQKKQAASIRFHDTFVKKEELDLYDIVSEYLVSEGFCDSYDDADVIMANMSEEWRESILESAKDQSDKQIERGVKTTYKAGNVLDNRHQGRSRGLEKIDPRERDSKVERMRARLDSRRDDLFKERNKREDEKMEKIRKLLGL